MVQCSVVVELIGVQVGFNVWQWHVFECKLIVWILLVVFICW